MAEKRPTLEGDPDDPDAYLKEFVAGRISYNPDKLAQAYMEVARQHEGAERHAFQALAWAVGATRSERRIAQKLQELEKRVRDLERRLREAGDGA